MLKIPSTVRLRQTCVPLDWQSCCSYEAKHINHCTLEISKILSRLSLRTWLFKHNTYTALLKKHFVGKQEKLISWKFSRICPSVVVLRSVIPCLWINITLTWWWQTAENVWFNLFNFNFFNVLALDFIIINNKIDYIYLVVKKNKIERRKKSQNLKCTNNSFSLFPFNIN